MVASRGVRGGSQQSGKHKIVAFFKKKLDFLFLLFIISSGKLGPIF
jgi:hypothetical protein